VVVNADGSWRAVLLPLAAIAVFLLVIVNSNTFVSGERGAPLPEELTVERIEIRDYGLTATVRSAGAQEFRLAQVMVDGGFWMFTQLPAGPLARGESAKVHIE
jgi:hypothetical protein